MQKIKRHLQYTVLAAMTMFTIGLATPLAPVAEAKCEGAASRMFTFPKWYQGLSGTCANPQIRQLNDFWVIVLNFIEILLQVVAYVAAGFLAWGGFKYIKSEGDPGKISEAKMAIINAIIGLVIAMASVALVDFVQGGIISS